MVLLIERAFEPYKGQWAFPGGFMEMEETTDECALRELQEETGITGVKVKQFHTFSRVDRDPRGRVVTVAYYTLVDVDKVRVKAGDDAKKAEWFPLQRLPALAFDHEDVLQKAVLQLQYDIQYQPENLIYLNKDVNKEDLTLFYQSILDIDTA